MYCIFALKLLNCGSAFAIKNRDFPLSLAVFLHTFRLTMSHTYGLDAEQMSAMNFGIQLLTAWEDLHDWVDCKQPLKNYAHQVYQKLTVNTFYQNWLYKGFNLSNILRGSVKCLTDFRKSGSVWLTVTHMYPCMLVQDLCFYFKLLFPSLIESRISRFILLKPKAREESKHQFIYVEAKHWEHLLQSIICFCPFSFLLKLFINFLILQIPWDYVLSSVLLHL